MKKKEPTDEEILEWLSRCDKIDHSGYDAGWSFERLETGQNMDYVADVKISLRGHENGGLRVAAKKAMMCCDDIGGE